MTNGYQRWFYLNILFCGFLIIPLVESNVNCEYAEAKQDANRTHPCICYQENMPSWKEKVKPAPKPKNASIKFQMKEPIHPKIIWTQRGSFIKRGYFMELYVHCPTMSHISSYICNVEASALRHQELVTFEFENCCASIIQGSGFNSGDVLSVTIFGRPMYNSVDNTNSIEAYATIPELAHTHTRKKKQRKKKSRRTRDGAQTHNRSYTNAQVSAHYALQPSRVYHDDEQGDGDLTIAAAVLSTSLFGIMILILYQFIKCSKGAPNRRPNGEIEPRRILLIAVDDRRYIFFVNKIAELLKKYSRGSTEVTLNMQRINEIADKGVIRWVTRKMEEAEVVVTIVTEPEHIQLQHCISGDQTCSCVGVTLSLAESKALKHGFKSTKKKFIVLNTFTCDSLPFCTHYFIHKDLNNFLKHALGSHYQYSLNDEDCGTLLKLLSNAQNVPKDLGAVRKKRTDCVTYTDKQLNDLDKSVVCITVNGKASMTPNIAQGELPSIENNSCK